MSNERWGVWRELSDQLGFAAQSVSGLLRGPDGLDMQAMAESAFRRIEEASEILAGGSKRLFRETQLADFESGRVVASRTDAALRRHREEQAMVTETVLKVLQGMPGDRSKLAERVTAAKTWQDLVTIAKSEGGA
jgi:hypothetical protein